jgi:hypothetical protein
MATSRRVDMGGDTSTPPGHSSPPRARLAEQLERIDLEPFDEAREGREGRVGFGVLKPLVEAQPEAARARRRVLRPPVRVAQAMDVGGNPRLDLAICTRSILCGAFLAALGWDR